MRRLVLLDIDGTVVSHSTNPSHIPTATVEALRLLAASGHCVAFNTARSFSTAARLMRELSIPNAVLCNGAHIVFNGKTVFLEHIDADALRGAARLAADGGCSVYAADERNLYTDNVEESNLSYLASQCDRRGMLKPLEKMKRACKMEIYGSFIPDEAITSKACVIMENGGASLLPPGATKARGLERLAELTGFALAGTVAVGDGRNDIGMLKAAGVGVAVGGAPAEVKEAADIVTGNIEDGGIFDAFRRLELI